MYACVCVYIRMFVCVLVCVCVHLSVYTYVHMCTRSTPHSVVTITASEQLTSVQQAVMITTHNAANTH